MNEVVISGFNLQDYEKCEDEIGFDKDGNVFTVYKSKESVITFGSTGRMRVMVDKNMNQVSMKLPCFSWGEGYTSMTRTDFESQFFILSKVNSQL